MSYSKLFSRFLLLRRARSYKGFVCLLVLLFLLNLLKEVQLRTSYILHKALCASKIADFLLIKNLKLSAKQDP